MSGIVCDKRMIIMLKAAVYNKQYNYVSETWALRKAE